MSLASPGGSIRKQASPQFEMRRVCLPQHSVVAYLCLFRSMFPDAAVVILCTFQSRIQIATAFSTTFAIVSLQGFEIDCDMTCLANGRSTMPGGWAFATTESGSSCAPMKM